MIRRILSLTAAAILLSGCAASTMPPQPNISDGAAVKLAEAASSVSQSLQTMAQVQQAIHPNAKLSQPPSPAVYGMGGLGSVDWSGPIEPFVRKIAAATNYKVTVLGKKPAIPLIVTVYAQDIPLGQILRDAGFQLGKLANIIVFPATRTIELRYGAG